MLTNHADFDQPDLGLPSSYQNICVHTISAALAASLSALMYPIHNFGNKD